VDKNLVDRIRELIADIERRVPYASVTNFEGESLEIRIDRKDEKLSNPKANRGLVLTVFNGEHFQEFATDDDDPDLWSRFFRAAADSVSVRPSKYEIPVGAGGEAAYRTEVAIDPDRKSTVEKLDLMRTRRDRILKSSQVVNAMVTYTERRENKIFINRARTVEEQIRRITNFLIAFVTDGKTMKTNFIVCGGTGGLERIDVRDERIDAMVETARKLLGAQRSLP
jgi:TldD protein